MFWFIIGAILLGFLPQHIRHDGYISIVFLLGSTIIFHLLESASRRLNESHSRFSLIFFTIFLMIHAITDGLGLGITETLGTELGHHSHNDHHHHTEEVLAYSIILHRLPAGIGIWTFLFPQFGWRKPTLLFAMITIATIVGFLGANLEAAKYLDGPQIHFLEYMIAGGLLHFGVHAATKGKNKASATKPA